MFRVTDNQQLYEIIRGEQSGTGARVLTLILFPVSVLNPRTASRLPIKASWAGTVGPLVADVPSRLGLVLSKILTDANIWLHTFLNSSHSSAGTATGYEPNGQGSIPCRDKRFFAIPQLRDRL
jgi:hypothetical protein